MASPGLTAITGYPQGELSIGETSINLYPPPAVHVLVPVLRIVIRRVDAVFTVSSGMTVETTSASSKSVGMTVTSRTHGAKK